MTAPRRTLRAVAAWIGLTLFHAFGVFVFAGWMGVADDFIPWSIAAFLLWRWTHSYLQLRRLRESWLGRGIAAVWLILLVLAVWGIDHRQIAVPIETIAIAYLIAPLLPLLLVPAAAAVRHRGVSGNPDG